MKRLRHRAIREIVAGQAVRTQRELAAALAGRGFRTTQATVSRDVAELGLVKELRGGTLAYAVRHRAGDPAEPNAEERLRSLLRDLPVELRVSGLLLVARSLPGSAHAIAAALDRMHWKDVAGSIAGDDTVFIACSDGASLTRLRRRLERLLRRRG